MARASHNHNFFGFLLIFGSSSTSNSPLQPFFHLQVFQNEKSYTFLKKKKKSSFSLLSCSLPEMEKF